MPAVAKGLVSVCAIVEPLDALSPVIPPVIVPIVQLKVAPVTLLFNVIFVVVPLQIVVGLAVVTFGFGFIVTTMFVGAPGQPFADGVTIYVTVPAVVPGLVSVCAIVDPLDALAPVIPPVIDPIVQLKVAPVTLLFNAIFVAVPLQIVVGLAVVTFGVGYNVTVTVNVNPVQLPDIGVTV